MPKITPAPERFWPKVQKTETCWVWTGFIDPGGYGQFRVDPHPAAQMKAHRFAYEEVHGPIPEGLTIDHLCRNTRCVNPAHLEAVTIKVNTLRGFGPTAENARKTHCIHGHRLPPRVEGARRRRCMVCHNGNRRAARVARKMAA